MSDNKRPLGRHELTEEEKARVRAEAEARYRAEVEAQLQAQAQASPQESAVGDNGGTPAEPAPPKPKTATQRAQEEAALRRAALPPEQRAREDRRALMGCSVFALLIVGGLFLLLQSCNQGRAERRAQEEARAATLAGQNPYLIREHCLESVRSKLKAPATARFEDRTVPTFNNGSWAWGSYVDAQNSFGAMIRTSFVCTVTGTTADDARVQTVLLD